MTTHECINLLRRFKVLHAHEYGIERMGIFGSMARGEQTEKSDVDIFYEGSSMGLKSLVQLPLDLEELLGTPVDVVRKHTNIRPKFLQRIEKEIIYV
jgi:predicted nucleotidyltransferase